jgi:NlpC/P60 family putative phage cell wall peptidase
VTDCPLPIAYCPEAEGRARIVAAARAWLGTPYHHAADVKGAGVDCAMLLVRVFCDLKLVEPFDPRPYTKDWMLHRGEERFLGFLLARSIAVASPEAGDVVIFRVGRCFAHGAIVTRADPLTIIHAYGPARRVVEDEVARHPALAEELRVARFASIRSIV